MLFSRTNSSFNSSSLRENFCGSQPLRRGNYEVCSLDNARYSTLYMRMLHQCEHIKPDMLALQSYRVDVRSLICAAEWQLAPCFQQARDCEMLRKSCSTP